jgi:hypothetical protein
MLVKALSHGICSGRLQARLERVTTGPCKANQRHRQMARFICKCNATTFPNATTPYNIERPNLLRLKRLILYGAPPGGVNDDAWVRRLANMGWHVNQAWAQSLNIGTP